MNDKMPHTPFSTPLSGSAKETEIRIRNIMSGPKRRPPVLFLALVFSVCIFCGNLVSCQVKETEGAQPGGSSSQEVQGTPADLGGLSADGAEEALLQALCQVSGETEPFQSPSARLLDYVQTNDLILGAALMEDHLENTLLLGVMDKETRALTGPVFQYAVKNGFPNVVTVYPNLSDYNSEEGPCLLYTFNGQENGQYTGQAGLVCLDGKDLAWKWPAEGDVRDPDSPAGQAYRDFWTGYLAVAAPGGVDVYAVNPDFEWGGDEPWSIWQLDHNETFWEAEEIDLPMPIYFQSLSWLVGYTNDPGGWRVLSLKPNRERADLEARMDCFTLTACMDNGTGTFTADLFFSYDSEPARPRSYSELIHAEVRAPLPSAAVPDPETRAAYVRVLENLLNNSILPDNSDGTGIFSDMADNTFAVADVDGDGREELVLLTRPNIYAGYRGYILECYNNTLVIQHSGFPSFTFYSNGAFTEDDSHAQGSWTSQFWPHNIYRYLSGSDSYELAGHVDAWEKVISDINPESLPPFPTEKDKSGAGILYYIHPISSYEYLNTSDSRVNMAVDQSVYLEWLEPILGDAKPVELEYLPLTEENINRLN
ncbi:MAG: hypothetical protein HFF51_01135 [Lawsonibacter sp.]|nr:hypothetical protein [Lawsonibacter sp.]